MQNTTETIKANLISKNVREVKTDRYNFFVIKLPFKAEVGGHDLSNHTFTLSPEYVSREIVETIERPIERYVISLVPEHSYKLSRRRLKDGISAIIENDKCVNSPADFETYVIYVKGRQIKEALDNARESYIQWKQATEENVEPTL